MPPKESAETKHAIYLVETDRKSIATAARLAGIHPTTLRRALERRGKWDRKKRVDMRA